MIISLFSLFRLTSVFFLQNSQFCGSLNPVYEGEMYGVLKQFFPGWKIRANGKCDISDNNYEKIIN